MDTNPVDGDATAHQRTAAASGGREASTARVLSIGLVPPGASGVRDYGRLLADDLRRRGLDVDERWFENEGRALAPAVSASRALLRSAMTVRRPVTVVWHYSSFAYGLRGVPLAGVLAGVVLRARGIPVLTILHEPAYPWGRRGWHGRIQAITQWAVVPVVLLGTTAGVVTTEKRLRRFRRVPYPLRRPLQLLPVFSTIPVSEGCSERKADANGPTLGVLGYTGDGSRPDLLFDAVAGAGAGLDSGARILLVGSPGPTSPDGQEVQRLAEASGVADHVTFTGILGPGELSDCLQCCDVVLILNEEGPSSRRTTLAAALAHGMPTLCLDGPDRWEELVEAKAVIVVGRAPEALASSLSNLLADADERAAQGARARRFYSRRMGVERVGADVAQMLATMRRE